MNDGERLRRIAISVEKDAKLFAGLRMQDIFMSCVLKAIDNKLHCSYLKTDNSRLWKPCLLCGGSLFQVRKALFKCKSCKLEIIADENDMVAEQ